MILRLSAYALAVRCPVLTSVWCYQEYKIPMKLNAELRKYQVNSAIGLGSCYTKLGTDGTDLARGAEGMCLRVCHAMPGTDPANGATRLKA
eukprot:2921066-Rhodomonas_salina.7